MRLLFVTVEHIKGGYISDDTYFHFQLGKNIKASDFFWWWQKNENILWGSAILKSNLNYEKKNIKLDFLSKTYQVEICHDNINHHPHFLQWFLKKNSLLWVLEQGDI